MLVVWLVAVGLPSKMNMDWAPLVAHSMPEAVHHQLTDALAVEAPLGPRNASALQWLDEVEIIASNVTSSTSSTNSTDDQMIWGGEVIITAVSIYVSFELLVILFAICVYNAICAAPEAFGAAMARIRASRMPAELTETPAALTETEGVPAVTSLWPLVESAGARFGALPYVETFSSATGQVVNTLTFSDLVGRVRRARIALVQFGVPANARIAFLCQATGDEFVGLTLAVTSIGTAVMLNWRQPLEVLRSALVNVGATYLVIGEGFEEEGKALQRAVSGLTLVGLDLPGMPLAAGVSWSDLVGAANKVLARHPSASDEWPKGLDPAADRSEEIAVIVFTTGSTAEPKAVPHTHRGVLSNCRMLYSNYAYHTRGKAITEPPATLCLLPTFHVIGLVNNMIFNLSAGVRCVVHKEAVSTALTAPLLLSAIKAVRPAYVDTVPWLLEQLAERLPSEPETVAIMRGCVYFSYGGAPLATAAIDLYDQAGLKLMNHFGQTELGSMGMTSRLLLPVTQVSHLRPAIGSGAEAYILDADNLNGPPTPEQFEQAVPLVSAPIGLEGNLIIVGHGGLTRQYLVSGGTKPVGLGLPDGRRAHNTGDVFRVVKSADGRPSVMHAMRKDDLIVHSSGEMTNPLVFEDGVLKVISTNGRAADVHKLILLGQRRATPILIVELTPSSSSDAEVKAWLWPLVQEANKLVPEYSAVRKSKMVLLRLNPAREDNLPLSIKGAVIRGKAEEQLKATLDLVDAGEYNGAGGDEDDADLKGGTTEEEIEEVDSLATSAKKKGGGSSGGAEVSHSATEAVRNHGYLVLLFHVVCAHSMTGLEAPDMLALHLDYFLSITAIFTWFAMAFFLTTCGATDYILLGNAQLTNVLLRIAKMGMVYVLWSSLGVTINQLFYDGILSGGNGWWVDSRLAFQKDFMGPTGLWFIVVQTMFQALLLGLYILLDYGKPATGSKARPLCAYVGAVLALLLFLGCEIDPIFCPDCLSKAYASENLETCSEHWLVKLMESHKQTGPASQYIDRLTAIPFYSVAFFAFPLVLPRAWPATQPTIFKVLQWFSDLLQLTTWPYVRQIASYTKPAHYICFWIACLGVLIGLFYIQCELTTCSFYTVDELVRTTDIIMCVPMLFMFAALMPTKWTIFATMGSYSVFIFVAQSSTRMLNTRIIIWIGEHLQSPELVAFVNELALTPLFFLITVYPLVTVWRWLTSFWSQRGRCL